MNQIDTYEIVALPVGAGPAEATVQAGDPRSALNRFACDHGVVGHIEDDAEHGVILNGDRLIYAAVNRSERHRQTLRGASRITTLDTRTGRMV